MSSPGVTLNGQVLSSKETKKKGKFVVKVLAGDNIYSVITYDEPEVGDSYDSLVRPFATDKQDVMFMEAAA